MEASHTLDIWGNVSLLELNKRLEVTSAWPGAKEHEEEEGSSRHSSLKLPATGTLEQEFGAICGDRRSTLEMANELGHSLGYCKTCKFKFVVIHS